MNTQDILIVGAGLAGLSTAIEYLERGGAGRVTIVEALNRKNELHPGSGRPGAGFCSGSGGLGTAMLKQIGYRLPADVVMSTINRMIVDGPTETVTMDGDFVGTPGQPVGVVTDKHKFGDWLLERAIALGADYRPGWNVGLVARHVSKKWCVLRSGTLDEPETPDNHITADFLVGADGPRSVVAQACFGAPEYDPRDCFTASEVYLRLQSFPRDQISLKFLPSRIHGYYWRFSAGDLTKVGMGSTLERGINSSAETTWYRQQEAQRTGDASYLGKPVRHIGGIISGSRPLPTVCDARYNMAVVGEAGRMVMASIGAGDSMAVESGRMLGAALANNTPAGYQTMYAKQLRPYLRRHYRVKNALLSLDDKLLDRGLRLLRNYKPRSTNTRTEVVRLMRYLFVSDPFFVGRAAWKALA